MTANKMNEPSQRPVVCWFRRDLRVADNPAFHSAVATGLPVIPLFVVDSDLIAGIPSDGAVFDFQAEALRDLDENLKKLGGRLIVRKGRLLEVFSSIIAEAAPIFCFFNRDYEPSALERDSNAANFLQSKGISVSSFKDVVIHAPDEVLTTGGGTYAVFTPYAAKWKTLSKSTPVGRPARFVTPHLRSDDIPGASSIGRKVEIQSPAVRGGETNAKSRWEQFLGTALAGYGESRDIPSIDGTSMMSPYLRFGCISPVRMYADLLSAALRTGRRDFGDKYLSELIWREFYTAVLYHFPLTAGGNYRREFDSMKWNTDGSVFKAWKEGRTGFPLVDAGIRQLNRTGWMHNRVRMVVASFLTKDLLTDWREGEKYFATKLLDIEKASNVGGWQWSASTGVDPKPLRIFNPTLQAERYDPEGKYIRKWIPELRNVPAKFIFEPWKMGPALQGESGVLIGKDYPAPIVDHREAAASFKRAYYSVKDANRAPETIGSIKRRK